MTMHRQKHPGQKTDNGTTGDPQHSFQVILLLSIVVCVVSFFVSVYWDKIIEAAAFIAATERQLHEPALSAEYIFGESGVEVNRKAELTDPNSASLHKTFSLDFKQVLRIRLRNMKKYSYNYSVYGIDRRANLSLQEFRDVYDGKWPVIITDVIPKWPAANWTGLYYARKFGKDRVTMEAVDEQNPQNSDNLGLPLELFYEHIKDATPNQWTYIGDELFILMRPELYNALGDILYLEEDFYQLFPPEIRPWNAMMLWGTVNSHSTFHMDPYNWSGTNAVIWGTKRWKMYPPGQDHFLYATSSSYSQFPLNSRRYNSKLDAYNIDHEEYPLFSYGKSIDFDQHAGELLLLPTGWYHQVYNLEETFAVSSEWMNRNNYRVILEEIFKLQKHIRASLSKDVDSYTPAEKVKAIFRDLPVDILEKGLAKTKFLANQVHMTPAEMDRKGYHLPFHKK